MSSVESSSGGLSQCVPRKGRSAPRIHSTLALLVAHAAAVVAEHDAQRHSFRPGSLWRDSLGQPIRAHSAGLLSVASTWYLYGADHYRPAANGSLAANSSHSRLQALTDSTVGVNRRINVYSSRDLVNWRPHGSAFVNCEVARQGNCYVDRPKVLHDTKGGRFVMVMKATPLVAVAVASSPLGPFRLVGHLAVAEHVGDCSAFADPRTGRAVLVYSVRPNATHARVLRLALLSEDLLRVEAPVATIHRPREAPALFYEPARRRYYLLCSRASGWKPNAAELFSAPALAGPWISEGNPTRHPTSFDSQVTFVLPVARNGVTRFVYVADRFMPHITGPLCGEGLCESGRYVWLPMRTHGSSGGDGASPNVTVEWREAWRLDALFDR